MNEKMNKQADIFRNIILFSNKKLIVQHEFKNIILTKRSQT